MPTGQSRTDAGLSGVEQRGDTGLDDGLVDRVEAPVVGLEVLHARVELEAPDAELVHQPVHLSDRRPTLPRVDGAERDEHVVVLGRDLGLHRVRCVPGSGRGVDGGDDRGQVALAVVGSDGLDRRGCALPPTGSARAHPESAQGMGEPGDALVELAVGGVLAYQ